MKDKQKKTYPKGYRLLKKGILTFCLLYGLSVCFVNARMPKFFSSTSADSGYIRTYRNVVIGRLYLSQKYTSIGIGGSTQYPEFKYLPNTSLNLGFGLTYKIFTINLAYGFPGLNGNSSQRGKTQYLDLQSHIYSRNFVVDFFGQFYKGFYIAPKAFVPGFPGYYQNPDLRVRLFGLSTYYLFNGTRFSYQASQVQNEWQTRSSGTFLAGLNINYGLSDDQQSLVPQELQNYFAQGYVQRLRFLNFGPGLGYAYNFIYKKHWFATGSLTATLTVDFSRETTEFISRTHTTVNPNFLYRLGLGYNSEKWEVAASLVNNTVITTGAFSRSPYRFRTGNFRLAFAYRFPMHTKLEKKLNEKMQFIERKKSNSY